MYILLFYRLSRASLLWGLLLGSRALLAQSTPYGQTAYWQAAYWQADYRAVRQELRSQRTDSARLHTLRHLADLRLSGSTSVEDSLLLPQLIALTGRLRTPDHHAYQLVQAADRLLRPPLP